MHNWGRRSRGRYRTGRAREDHASRRGFRRTDPLGSSKAASWARYRSWATIRLATTSSIGVPRNTMAVLQEQREDVVAALTPARLLDNHRHGVGERIAHVSITGDVADIGLFSL